MNEQKLLSEKELIELLIQATEELEYDEIIVDFIRDLSFYDPVAYRSEIKRTYQGKVYWAGGIDVLKSSNFTHSIQVCKILGGMKYSQTYQFDVRNINKELVYHFLSDFERGLLAKTKLSKLSAIFKE